MLSTLRDKPVALGFLAAAKKLVSALQTAVGWVGFCLLRSSERLVPTTVLSILLRPPAAVFDLMRVRQRKLVPCWRRFPKSWRPKPGRFFLHQGLGLCHARLLYTWPDRLCTPRWLNRCRLEGGRDFTGDKGVVLASLHFGPFETLPYWLRAHGIVTTMIRGAAPPASLQSLAYYQYRLSEPAEIPIFILASELAPVPRFARVSSLLGPGRRLLVTVDADRGLQMKLPLENRTFRMATGAIRLAAMAGADLVPCLITETGWWKFALHFGAPVPGEYLGDSPNLKAAGTHLLTEFSKVISRYPEQCRLRLLAAISPELGEAHVTPESQIMGKTSLSDM